jgi:hypothetical protein
MNGNDDKSFDDELMARAGTLATEVRPERDLWPEIEQAIAAPAAPRRAGRGSMWAQAAAVVLLVGGSSGLTYLAMDGRDDPTVPSALSPAGEFRIEPVSANFGSQYTLGPDFIDARRVLKGSFEEELVNLSPEAREEVLQNLDTIRQAINDINEALSHEPDNVLLQKLLLDTYRSELSLMMQVDGITRNAMYRGDI